MTEFLNNIKPKRILCNKKANELINMSSGSMNFMMEPSLEEGSFVEISPAALDSSVYVGSCPMSIAADLVLSDHGNNLNKICRLPQVDLEMKD